MNTPSARKPRGPAKEAQANAAAAAKRAGKKVSGAGSTRRGNRNNTDENQPPSPATTGSDPPQDSSSPSTNPLRDVGNVVIEDDVAAIRAELAAMRADKERLEKELDLAKKSATADENGGTTTKDKRSIPRPNGVAGRDFSIQKAMGLVGSKKREDKYQSVLRWVRELTLQSRINWELPWAKIPPEEKAKLFKVVVHCQCRTKNPLLERYTNDWATEEVVKQYIRNKRHYGYKHGFVEKPEGYGHLKVNASKRTNAPRGRKAGGVAGRSNGAQGRDSDSDVNEPSMGEDGEDGEEADAPGPLQNAVLIINSSSGAPFKPELPAIRTRITFTTEFCNEI
ncbi:hypothetical protein H0H93_008424 [Arthromyces matolae]|nr:hypothetical protein H0H93_008424 [Arthromyces matolae]